MPRAECASARYSHVWIAFGKWTLPFHAWVQVSPQRPTGRGKLSEIPFGVKDIIETQGLATEYGSPIYKGRIGTADAAIVREMRKRGAILLGKTHCTAFAYFT